MILQGVLIKKNKKKWHVNDTKIDKLDQVLYLLKH